VLIGQQSRQSDRQKKYARALLVCAAASALFLARNSAPKFSDASSVHAVEAGSHHDQRPRFENRHLDANGLPYCPTNTVLVVSPPAETRGHLTLATTSLFSFLNKGAHYNRPPPVFFL
jgi:hypothetical protein